MFKNNIKWRRETLPEGPITQTFLSQQMGRDKSYISRVENGKRIPGLELLFKLAQYFKCRPGEIFQYIPEKEDAHVNQR